MAEKRIALVIAGGVSLGSYEAGSLTEILYALETLNQQGRHRYMIDITTGGSAGSITGALVARIMTHNYQRMRHVLRKVWVCGVDIDGFMEESGEGSILSNNKQRELAEKYLVSPDCPPGAQASCAAHEIHLSFTASNLVGVDYTIPYKNLDSLPDSASKSFVTTDFRDFCHFTLNGSNREYEDFWKEVADAVMASGSFPIAFPPSKVRRTIDDYPKAKQRDNQYLPETVYYYDGGIFNNEPLKRAIDLASKIDGGAIYPGRTFILIDPNLNKSGQRREFIRPQKLSTNMKGLLNMVMGQVVTRDWMKATEYNRKVRWMAELADEMVAAANAFDRAALHDRLDQLKARVHKIISEKGRLRSKFDPTAYLRQKVHDIEKNYGAQLNALSGPSDEEVHQRKDILKHLILLANLASGQTSKSLIDLWVIGADDSQVAGEDFFAFAGFFEEKWRAHDFRVGRKATYNQLGRILGATYPMEPDLTIGTGVNRHYDIEPGWEGFKDVRFKDASKTKRKRLCTLLVDKLDGILKEELNLGWLKRWAIRKLFLRPTLKKQLQL